MLMYCLKCRKNTKSKNRKFARTKNGRIMLSSKCEVCNSKKLKFIKEQETSESLSGLGERETLIKMILKITQLYPNCNYLVDDHMITAYSCAICVSFHTNHFLTALYMLYSH